MSDAARAKAQELMALWARSNGAVTATVGDYERTLVEALDAFAAERAEAQVERLRAALKDEHADWVHAPTEQCAVCALLAAPPSGEPR